MTLQKGLKQHTRMKHRISKLEGIDDTDLSYTESKAVKNPVQNRSQLCKDGPRQFLFLNFYQDSRVWPFSEAKVKF